MDWTKIKFPEIDSRIQPGSLPFPDHWEFIVLAKLLDQSASSLAKEAIVEWMNANREELERRLTVAASARNVTPEELFSFLIQKGSSLDDINGLNEYVNRPPEQSFADLEIMREVFRKLLARETISGVEVTIAARALNVTTEKLADYIRTQGGILNGK